MYVYGYPRTLYTGWLSPIINMDEVVDVSMYIYPVESAVVMKNLRTKATQLEASMNLNAEKGKEFVINTIKNKIKTHSIYYALVIYLTTIALSKISIATATDD